jgi:hypothetical protein
MRKDFVSRHWLVGIVCRRPEYDSAWGQLGSRTETCQILPAIPRVKASFDVRPCAIHRRIGCFKQFPLAGMQFTNGPVALNVDVWIRRRRRLVRRNHCVRLHMDRGSFTAQESLDQAIDARKAQNAETDEPYDPKCAIAMIE